ncbi:hypothetical protein [Streptacidiphilus rugosus]|uniref:hypothetical protein n=1 Tax=Streptacidiphilus rugosus TaxID=405783 RepID=UPI000690EFB6|nr:hypothetical protein [Streptacidiphilus rugosus]
MNPGRFQVDLSGHRTNAACAGPGAQLLGGGFDGFGKWLPAEDFAALADQIGGLPGRWGAGGADNVECQGQQFLVAPPAPVRAVGVVGAGTGGSLRDELTLLGPEGAREQRVPLALSDFLAGGPAFGEEIAAEADTLRIEGIDIKGPRPKLWRSRRPLPAPFIVASVRLPFNPGLHVFSLWFEI